MNNNTVFKFFKTCVECGYGIKRTKKEQAICERALRRFESGYLDLSECYKKPSQAKISAYLECEYQWREHEVVEVCGSVLGYNCSVFSWVGLWVDRAPSIDGYVTIYLKYNTAWKSKLIKVCSVPYEYVK